MERIPSTAMNAATLSDENPIICIKNKNGNLIIDQKHISYHTYQCGNTQCRKLELFIFKKNNTYFPLNKVENTKSNSINGKQGNDSLKVIKQFKIVNFITQE